MAPRVDIIDNPYTRQLSILIDNKPLSVYSVLEKYMDEPFYYWCDKIIPAIYEELNGNNFFLTLKAEPKYLEIMESICKEHTCCLGFSGTPLSKSTPLTERMSKLNRLIKNNNVTGYKSFNHNSTFIVSEKYSNLKNELLDISIDNLFCHVHIDVKQASEFQFHEAENESVFIICDESDVEKMISKTGINKGFVLSISDKCRFDKKKEEVFYFSTTIQSVFNSIFDCFKLVILNDIFFSCVNTLSYDIKNRYQKELNDITGTSPTLIPKVEKFCVEVGGSVCINFESDTPGFEFDPKNLQFVYSNSNIVKCDGVRVVGLNQGKTKMFVYQKGEIQPSAEFEFSCIKRNRITSIKLNENRLFVGYGDTETLMYSIWPDDADNADEIKFTSEDDNVVSVSSDGTLYGEGVGSCTVWVMAGNVSVSCDVNVLPHMKKIVFPEKEIYINPGEKISVIASTEPEMCINNKLDYSCVDVRIANVVNSKLIGVSCGDTRLVIQNHKEHLRVDIPVHVGYRKSIKESRNKKGFFGKLFG